MLRVADIMTRDLVTVTPETTIREAMEMLSTKHLSGAPVVVGKRVVGVVSITDFLGFLISSPEPDDTESAASIADSWDRSDEELEEEEEIQASMMSDEAWDDWSEPSERGDDGASPQGDHVLDQHTVDEVMTDKVFSVPPDASVKAAATMMRKRGIHRVLVMKGESLVGIVSAFDVARTVSDKGTAEDTAVKARICKGEPSAWISDDLSR